jgi:SAM-dependent methyltransferase
MSNRAYQHRDKRNVQHWQADDDTRRVPILNEDWTHTDNRNFHNNLGLEERNAITRRVNFADCWRAYLQPRKSQYAVDSEQREKYTKFKIEQISEDKLLNTIICDAKPTSLLDVGCGDGYMGKIFAETFGIKDVQYTDVVDVILLKNVQFTTFKPDEPLPFKRQFSIISCFHILHHIPTEDELIFRLKDIHSRLQPGGLLIIREHDASNELMKKRIKLSHICYELREIDTGKTKDELIKWINGYDLNLYTLHKLKSIIESQGFQFVAATRPTSKDGSYYSVFGIAEHATV